LILEIVKGAQSTAGNSVVVRLMSKPSQRLEVQHTMSLTNCELTFIVNFQIKLTKLINFRSVLLMSYFKSVSKIRFLGLLFMRNAKMLSNNNTNTKTKHSKATVLCLFFFPFSLLHKVHSTIGWHTGFRQKRALLRFAYNPLLGCCCCAKLISYLILNAFAPLICFGHKNIIAIDHVTFMKCYVFYCCNNFARIFESRLRTHPIRRVVLKQ